jgi:Uma2 family endonuclease
MRTMAQAAPVETRYTVQRYFELVETGVVHPDDRVELLEGVIVAMSPQNPLHASATRRAYEALRTALRERAVISVQLPLVLGAYSAPEPDVAVLPGQRSDYDRAHPTTALLVVEVADSSLLQDRLTKAAVYAAAGIPEYWLVNLRDDCIEVFRAPDTGMRRYAEPGTRRRGEQLDLVAFPDAKVSVSDLLPGERA